MVKMEALMRESVGVAFGVAIGIAALAAPILASVAGIGANNAQRVLEATVRMERLATHLEHAKTIAPETKREIERLTRQPWYDCNQLACRKTLETRNRTARERLKAVLAGSAAPTEFGANTKEEVGQLPSASHAMRQINVRLRE
jgi:hypothetical protein